MNFNVPPYFDDYNEAKDFLRVLFRPEYGVQARELNQTQSILQKQVERVGRYLFEEGSAVVGGQTKVDLEFAFVRLSGLSLPVGISISDIKTAVESGKTVLVKDNPSTGTALQARVARVEEAAGGDPLTIYVRYENSGGNGTKKVFVKGETLTLAVFNGTVEDSSFSGSTLTVENNPSVEATGFGSAVSITEGTRFIKGFFVGVRPETLILDKYSNTPSYRVGLSATEEIVTENTDPSLFDNAIGSPNENAPGAHRYRIVLALRKLPFAPEDTVESSENFIPLVSLNAGEQQLLFTETRLATDGIQKQLAERTFDQNGNFVVQPFNINGREHLKDGDNDGKFSTAQGGDESKFIVEIDRGRAYVNGFLIDQTSTTSIVADKPRTSIEEQNILVTGRYGAWIDVELEGASGFVEPYTAILLFEVPVQQLDVGGVLPSEIGRAVVVNMLAGDTNKPRLYLSNIQMVDGYDFVQAKSYVATTAPAVVGASIARGNFTEAIFTGEVTAIENDFFADVNTNTYTEPTDPVSADNLLIVTDGTVLSDDYVSEVSLAWSNSAFAGANALAFSSPQVLSAPTEVEVVEDDVLKIIGKTFQVTHTNNSVQSWPLRVKTIVDTTTNALGTTYRRNRRGSDLYYPQDSNEIQIDNATTAISNQYNVSVQATLTDGVTTIGTNCTKITPVAGIPSQLLSNNANKGSAGVTFSGIAGWKLKAIRLTYRRGASDVEIWFKATSSLEQGGVVIKDGAFYIAGDRSWNVNLTIGGLDYQCTSAVPIIFVYENANYTRLNLANNEDGWTLNNAENIEGETRLVAEATIGGTPFYGIYAYAPLQIQRSFFTTLNNIEIFGSNFALPSYINSDLTVSNIVTTPRFSEVRITKRDNVVTTTSDVSPLAVGNRLFGLGLPSTGAVVLSKTTDSPNRITLDVVPSTDTPFDVIGTTDLNGGLKDLANSKIIAQIPFTFINSASDFIYSVNRSETFIADGGNFAYVVGSGEGIDQTGTISIINMNSEDDPVSPQSGSKAKVIAMSSSTVTKTATSISIDGSEFTSGQTYTVVIPVEKRANIEPKTKTLKTYEGTVTLDGSGRFTFGNIVDVVSFNYIKEGSTDVTSQYQKYTGVGDGFYDFAKIDGGLAKANVEVSVSITYYEHGTTTTVKDFFIFSSYGEGGTEEYNNIPTYDGINLRDAFDFRASATVSGEPLVPSYSIRADVGYYVGRIDKLVVDKDGNFELVKGQPDPVPAVPADKDGSMTLAILNLPPYVIDANDIDIDILEHKRFTFRDIADINKRLNRLEYYTTLNVLERLTAERPVFDGTDETVKQGFIVDNFSTQYIGDVESDEYRCSLDLVKGELRPAFETNAIELQVTSLQATDAGITSPVALVQNGDLIMLPMTQQFNKAISQPMVSRPVQINPFGVFNFEGILDISPDNDFWVNTRMRPRFARYFKQFEAVRVAKSSAYNNGKWNSVWNVWQDFWRGRPEGQTKTFESTFKADTKFQSKLEKAWGDGSISDVTTAFYKNHRRVIGVYPYMRSREILVSGERLRRNTRLFAFFDGINVSDYVYAAIYDTEGNITGYQTTAISSNSASLVTDSKGRFNAKFVIPNTENLRFLAGVRNLRFIDNQSNNLETATTVAEIPYSSEGVHSNYWWGRGVKSVRRAVRRAFLINQARLARSTYAPEEVNNFRDVWADPVAQTFVMDKFAGGAFVTGVGLYFGGLPDDPDRASPITVQLRTVENGIPTQTVLPFATATLQPEQILADNEGMVETRFEFQSPVYLEQDTEYALVVIADDAEYFLWAARVGDIDLNTNQPITKQPYIGRMFKSADAANWKEERTEDLRFNIYTAKFATSSGTVSFTNEPLQDIALVTNPFTFVAKTSNSLTIDVLAPDHGMREGSYATISGVTQTTFGTQPQYFNGTFVVEAPATADTFRITLTGLPVEPTTGTVGGGSNIKCSSEVRVNLFQLIAEEMSLAGTSTAWKVKIAQRDSNGNIVQAPNVPQGFNPDDNLVFTDTERLIASAPSEANLLSGQQSFKLYCTLSSFNENLTPVIDTKRLGLITVQNTVDKVDEPVQASYVTKRVALNEAATSMNVVLESNLPDGADIKVFGRFQTSADQDFNSLPWVELTLSESTPKVFTVDPNEFTELEYTGNQTIIPADYFAFAIKIEMYAEVSSRVPRVTSFRAIASNRP